MFGGNIMVMFDATLPRTTLHCSWLLWRERQADPNKKCGDSIWAGARDSTATRSVHVTLVQEECMYPQRMVYACLDCLLQCVTNSNDLALCSWLMNSLDFIDDTQIISPYLECNGANMCCNYCFWLAALQIFSIKLHHSLFSIMYIFGKTWLLLKCQ